MGHENHDKNEEVRGSSDRMFGFVFAVFFLIVALFPLLSGGPPRRWGLIVSFLFAAIALIVPAILAPLNKLWMRFGWLLHKLVNPIVLGVLFYAVVMPTSILMRLFGKDPLRLNLDPSAKSYWIKRDPPSPQPDSMKNQF